MKTDLQTLRNIGPKMEEHLIAIRIKSVEELEAVGALETTRRLVLSGLVKPHVMYYHCLEAAIQGRDIFSFLPEEKAELKALYGEMMEEFQ